jgi:hypothetical protein
VSGTEPRVSDASLGELFSNLTSDLSALMRDEMQLAKVELKDEVVKAGKAGGMFGGAGIAALMTALLLSFAAAWGLAEVMAAGWAFLIIGVIWGIAAAVLYLQGRQNLQHLDPTPHATVATLKEDVQWAKKQKP